MPDWQGQTKRLGLLIKVWGFAKYHHPKSADAAFNWDAEFIRLAPQMANAGSNDAVALMADWLDTLGAVATCEPCASLPEEMFAPPPTPAWLESNGMPEPLRDRIAHIYANRSPDGPTAQVTTAGSAGNPTFLNEREYKQGGAVDSELRLLALAKYWNALRYWFPYRGLMARDLNTVLETHIPRFMATDGTFGYVEALYGVAQEVGEGHSGMLRFSRPNQSGPCSLPVRMRYLGSRVVVDQMRAVTDGDGASQGLRTGDVITAIDGEPVATLRDRLRPFYMTAQEAGASAQIATVLPVGECGAVTLDIRRADEPLRIESERFPADAFTATPDHFRERAGESFQMIDGDIAYLKISSAKRDDIDGYMERAMQGRGLVLDLRSYPSDFPIYSISAWLTGEERPFVRATMMDMASPGAIKWNKTISIAPRPDGQRLDKPVMVLIDEASGSAPEFHAMAFRAAGATIVGSPSAGADGNVSNIAMPRGGAAQFTGIGVYYPDGGETQRIGILPDIHVEPTVEGVAAGRDEVLERAMEEIASRSTAETR